MFTISELGICGMSGIYSETMSQKTKEIGKGRWGGRERLRRDERKKQTG